MLSAITCEVSFKINLPSISTVRRLRMRARLVDPNQLSPKLSKVRQ